MCVRTTWYMLGSLTTTLAVACGESVEDVKHPLEPPGRDTRLTYDVCLLDGAETKAHVRPFRRRGPLDGT